MLLAFTAAQLAVIRLRVKEPELARPFRARPNISIRGPTSPCPRSLARRLTFVVWILALVTHPGARYAGPIWLAMGLVVFVVVRRSQHRGLLEHVDTRRGAPAGDGVRRILVPMKVGDIGEEMVATAIALAKERGAAVVALTVVRVPRKYELEGPLPEDVPPGRCVARGSALLGEDHGVEVDTGVVRARSIGYAIVEEARARGRPHRPRLGSPLATAVAVLLADRRLRAPPRAVRGARGGLSGRRLRGRGLRIDGPGSALGCASVNAVVIGCGRTGSAVAKGLAADGWDVTVVDENEDALGRLGPGWRGGFVLGHGMDMTVLARAGIDAADAAVVSTDGDNTNVVIGQVIQKRYGIDSVFVRVLDPARAQFYAERGLHTVCPTQTAISVLLEPRAATSTRRRRRERGLMYVVVAGGGKVGANLARSLLEMGHEVTLIEERPRPSPASSRSSGRS